MVLTAVVIVDEEDKIPKDIEGRVAYCFGDETRRQAKTVKRPKWDLISTPGPEVAYSARLNFVLRMPCY